MTSRPRVPVALIAGGTGGIGRAIALKLANEGHRIVFSYRTNEAAAHDLLAELADLGQPGRAIALDLANTSASAQAIDEILKVEERIDVLVYAAGPHVPMTHLSRVSPQAMNDQLHGDTAAFFGLIHAALPALRASQGAVVAVTTAATTRYPVRDGLSSAPKAGVEALVRGFAAEEGRFGVRLNAVGPGMLSDGMAARLIASGDLDEAALAITRRNIPLRRFGTAQDIAEAVAFLASDRANFISGQKLDVDGGYGV